MERTERFIKYRQNLFQTIAAALDLDPHHKDYEGELEIARVSPGYFHSHLKSTYRITLRCYVLGDKRQYEYPGPTLDACLDRAEKDLLKWRKEQIESEHSPPPEVEKE